MAEDLIQTLRPRQDYVMSYNDNDGKLADTIYIIHWGVDEPTLYAIFSKTFGTFILEHVSEIMAYMIY